MSTTIRKKSWIISDTMAYVTIQDLFWARFGGHNERAGVAARPRSPKRSESMSAAKGLWHTFCGPCRISTHRRPRPGSFTLSAPIEAGESANEPGMKTATEAPG
jgi:hypothetical protein